MANNSLVNPRPLIRRRRNTTLIFKSLRRTRMESDGDMPDTIDAQEVFCHLREISDPEHPYTLLQVSFFFLTFFVPHGVIVPHGVQLNVVCESLVTVANKYSRIQLTFTPTVPHCSMATLIGLCIRVKLLRALPSSYKIDICVTPGTHSSGHAVNKQLNDKERVAAALENANII